MIPTKKALLLRASATNLEQIVLCRFYLLWLDSEF